ncbi:LPXTG-motif cell wall-anchored protein [Arthrobacter sp. PvP023]|uniref:LPXTG cell wall anchor domain-containing protein n=1 Tax=Micrococcaceae TaxID=1268 RepID=UPI001AE311F9|nr:LPXTG cell wall anchor domain-containing protein [Arthrobacter sp. PvP023]MBP1135086.1 LPXTG-motif cell wall-anchored protein [Arthrobacter sp. PvP023]
MKKSLAAIALAGSIALVGAVPAMATTTDRYPAPGTCAAVSDGTVAPGETFTFSGTCFGANQVITITVTLTIAPQAVGGVSGGPSMSVPSRITLPLAPQTFTAKTDSNGDFSFPLTINEAGTYTLTASNGTDSYSTTVKVAGSEAGTGLANSGGTTTAGTGLANTGADASLILWSLVGAGALAAGATSVVVVRRRAKAEAAA